MPFTISARTSEGRVTLRRDTAVEAVQKVVEMIGAGAQDVYITDRERGKIYRPDEFPLLLKSW
ncbi:MAG TPA: hypothetical protein VN975_12525 [Xanthobacteraceae bacterium]|jgi:hypothetical protein|nr:hypothetical protein [Xanthobacteraceae bacterium]